MEGLEMIRFALFTVALLLVGCRDASPAKQDAPPTLKEAVSTLQQHKQVVIEALRAKNPAAADEALHEAMYLGDHLPEFQSSSEIDKTALEEQSNRLLNLLLQAHRGAHGSEEETWDPDALADEISECMDGLQSLLQEN